MSEAMNIEEFASNIPLMAKEIYFDVKNIFNTICFTMPFYIHEWLQNMDVHAWICLCCIYMQFEKFSYI